MRKIIKYSTLTLALLFLGCTKLTPMLPSDPKIDKSQTQYSAIRDDINSMVSVFYGKPINIIVDGIENKTKARAELPANISDVVNIAFNEIGENVNTIANPDMVGGYKQVYIIHGAITEFDVMEERNSGLNTDIEGGNGRGQWTTSGELGRESKITNMTIIFNPEDINKGSFIPKSSTSNRITIYQKSNANEFGFFIFGSGFGSNQSITKSQGIHSSIAVLVDLSVAEVLGKVAKFPYWLLTKGKVNEYLLNQLTEKFLDDKLNQKLYKISYLLALQDSSVQPTRVMTPALEIAIKSYKKTHGMRENLHFTQEFYRSLLGG